MQPTSVRTKPLVLTRQIIRVLSDANLSRVVGGGGLPVKQTQAGATCGDYAPSSSALAACRPKIDRPRYDV